MFFRIYIMIIIMLTSLLFTDVYFVSLLLLLWFCSIPMRRNSYFKNKRNTMPLHRYSLSCGMKSMKRQKSNFKIINKLCSWSPRLNQFFKRLSVALDDRHVKVVQSTYTIPENSNNKYSLSAQYHPSNIHYEQFD